MNGVLLVNKPKHMTSHDVVMKARNILGIKKIGHTGTLDPNAEGVLVLCVGKATKIVQFLTLLDKEYIAEVILGIETDTEDETGNIILKKKVEKIIEKEKIEEVLNSLLGEHEQTPPMYSAVSVKGKRLYEYAHKNIEVERPKRKVTIYSLDLINNPVLENETLKFQIKCNVSKGTYIRTLVTEIGKRLGYPAHLGRLVRTKQGMYTLNECITLEKLEKKEYTLLSIKEALKNCKQVIVKKELEKKVKNGAKIKLNIKDDIVLILNDNYEELAIYKKENNNTYSCMRGI
ncbi:MAG TPA: tRNA pseudouridine(55) synthase TruB [Tenericutes bacterium]|nr:tRNA pseudouridine(55) synthase TruB [Mycoplasmatota bacterium]